MIVNSIALQSSILSANNAAYGAMSANQARMDLLSGLSPNSNMGAVLNQEQALTFSGLQNWLAYKINMYQQEALKKRLDEDIKKSFSYFA